MKKAERLTRELRSQRLTRMKELRFGIGKARRGFQILPDGMRALKFSRNRVLITEEICKYVIQYIDNIIDLISAEIDKMENEGSEAERMGKDK